MQLLALQLNKILQQQQPQQQQQYLVRQAETNCRLHHIVRMTVEIGLTHVTMATGMLAAMSDTAHIVIPRLAVMRADTAAAHHAVIIVLIDATADVIDLVAHAHTIAAHAAHPTVTIITMADVSAVTTAILIGAATLAQNAIIHVSDAAPTIIMAAGMLMAQAHHRRDVIIDRIAASVDVVVAIWMSLVGLGVNSCGADCRLGTGTGLHSHP